MDIQKAPPGAFLCLFLHQPAVEIAPAHAENAQKNKHGAELQAELALQQLVQRQQISPASARQHALDKTLFPG